MTFRKEVRERYRRQRSHVELRVLGSKTALKSFSIALGARAIGASSRFRKEATAAKAKSGHFRVAKKQRQISGFDMYVRAKYVPGPQVARGEERESKREGEGEGDRRGVTFLLLLLLLLFLALVVVIVLLLLSFLSCVLSYPSCPVLSCSVLFVMSSLPPALSPSRSLALSLGRLISVVNGSDSIDTGESCRQTGKLLFWQRRPLIQINC